jgi:hypothetical protein
MFGILITRKPAHGAHRRFCGTTARQKQLQARPSSLPYVAEQVASILKGELVNKEATSNY